MSLKHEQCIYCSTVFDATVGAGDHIIPAALGEFRGAARFRRICSVCNNRIGRSEQQLLQCGLESLLRRYVNPRGRRNRKRGSSSLKAVLGARSPQSTVDHDDHHELVLLDRTDPSKVIPVDQLVVHDSEGNEEFIRLFPGMSVDGVQRRLRDWGKTPKTVWIHCTDSLFQEFDQLARGVIKGGTFRSLPDTEPGVHDVPGRMEFRMTSHAFRAIAKIALHYYLVHTRRRMRGDEAAFAAVRDFIMNGGDIERFFRASGRKFVMPFGNLPYGRSITPAGWCHVLAADESEGVAVVRVQLFVGPASVPPVHYVTLGTLLSKIIMPNLAWGHVYHYDTCDEEPTYAGHVAEAHLSRTRPWRR